LMEKLFLIVFRDKMRLLKKKKWCREHGYNCKDKNCKAEKLDKPPKCCHAILKFKDTDYFVMCELDKDHKGLHKGLYFAWSEYEEEADKLEYFRGANLFKMKLKRITERCV